MMYVNTNFMENQSWNTNHQELISDVDVEKPYQFLI